MLNKVIERHIKFMFIAFKNLNFLDTTIRTRVIQGFLEYVIQNPSSKQDNSQGWGNYKDEKIGKFLNVDLIYDKIKNNLEEFFGNEVLMPSLKKLRRLK